MSLSVQTTTLPTGSSTSGPTSTPTPACNLYEIPISEPGCAVSFSVSGHEDAMKACCKDAAVVSYFNDCGLYCAAADQTIKELQDCLFGEDVKYQDVFCNAGVNATASEASPTFAVTASASVISGGEDKGDDNDDKNGDDGDDANNDDDDKGSAAPRVELGVSKVGLTIGALLVSAVAFGAVQI